MPRPIHAPLTDRIIRRVQPQPTPIDVRDGELRGLILTVLPSGKRQWTVRYRARGKQRRLVLGNYPAMSIAKARKAARAEQSQIDRKDDPVAVRLAANAASTDTIDVLARDYLAKHARKRKRTADEDERVFNVYVLPRWRGRSVQDIGRRDVRDLVEGIADRGAPIMANRVLEIVRKAFNWAIKNDWDLDKGNPAAQIDKPGIEQKRDRVLTDDEIRQLWRVLSHFPATADKQAPGRKRATASSKGDPFCPVSPTLAAVQKIRLISAQRGGEVVKMRWADLDLDTGWWTIPPEHSKNGEAHRVYLTPDAMAIIEAQQPDVEQRGEFVFVGRQDALVEDRVKKAGAALSRVLGFEFRSHDLRRTAATRMAAAGIPSAHISHVLNHVEAGPKSTRVYDRHTYDPQKRLALETWARELTQIIADQPQKAAAIVPMRGRR